MDLFGKHSHLPILNMSLGAYPPMMDMHGMSIVPHLVKI
jgi:hypothetical protein